MLKIHRYGSLMILVLFLFFPLQMFGEEVNVFNDVTPSHPYFSGLKYLKEKGIINGYPDGSFKPDLTINRAEAMKLLILGQHTFARKEFTPTRTFAPDAVDLAKEVNNTATENTEASPIESNKQDQFTFSDFTLTDWFAPYIYYAYDKSIVQGYADHSFKPGNKINKAESVKIVFRTLLPDQEFPEVTKNPFIDVPFSSWFAKFVQFGKDSFFIQADSLGNFNPGSDITRAEFADIIYRVLITEENKSKDGKYDPSTSWPVFDKSSDGYTIKLPPNFQKTEEPLTGTIPEEDRKTINLWRKDTALNQENNIREYPNSASLIIDISPGPVDKNTEFAKLREAFGETSMIVETTIQNRPALIIESQNGSESVLDSYIYLPNSHMASLYGTYGNGDLSYENVYYLRKIRDSIDFTEIQKIDDGNKDSILTKARKNVQVDGMGKATLALFNDLSIIETDTIGVGTGPVDYYYSARTNLTLKYERHFDVVLDIVTGKTSDF